MHRRFCYWCAAYDRWRGVACLCDHGQLAPARKRDTRAYCADDLRRTNKQLEGILPEPLQLLQDAAGAMPNALEQVHGGASGGAPLRGPTRKQR